MNVPVQEVSVTKRTAVAVLNANCGCGWRESSHKMNQIVQAALDHSLKTGHQVGIAGRVQVREVKLNGGALNHGNR